MAHIKINIEQAILSESAKKPSYKIAKIGGAQTLVIPSDKKSDLQAVLAHLKSAKKAAVAGLSARIKAATAFTKANQTPKGPRKTSLKETYKTEKAKSTKLIKEAKADLRSANSVAKKAGLGGLNLPFSASDIVASGPGLAKSLKTIRALKLAEFGVTGKRGTFKPKFMRSETFDQISEKGKAGDYSKKPSQAEGIKRTKKRLAEKKATKKALTTPREISKAVNTTLNQTLKKFGLNNDLAHLSDKAGNLLDKTSPAKKDKIINTLRSGFEAQGVPTKSLRNGGFTVPGILKVNNSKQFGIEVSKLNDWVHQGKSKK